MFGTLQYSTYKRARTPRRPLAYLQGTRPPACLNSWLRFEKNAQLRTTAPSGTSHIKNTALCVTISASRKIRSFIPSFDIAHWRRQLWLGSAKDAVPCSTPAIQSHDRSKIGYLRHGDPRPRRTPMGWFRKTTLPCTRAQETGPLRHRSSPSVLFSFYRRTPPSAASQAFTTHTTYPSHIQSSFHRPVSKIGYLRHLPPAPFALPSQFSASTERVRRTYPYIHVLYTSTIKFKKQPFASPVLPSRENLAHPTRSASFRENPHGLGLKPHNPLSKIGYLRHLSPTPVALPRTNPPYHPSTYVQQSNSKSSLLRHLAQSGIHSHISQNPTIQGQHATHPTPKTDIFNEN